MAQLKTMMTYRLMVLLAFFLFGNSYLLLPDDVPAKAGWTDRYLRLVLLSSCLLFTTVAAVTILLYMRSAETKAAAAACKQGVADRVSPGPEWRRKLRELRELLFLVISLSFHSGVLALNTFEVGFQYRKGRVSVLSGSPAWMLLFILALEYVSCARLLIGVED